MENIRPCPYCGGEVEVVKLIKRENETQQPYRIQCYRCHATVARGIGYSGETPTEAKERIRQYEAEIAGSHPVGHSVRISQSSPQRKRDQFMSMASRESLDDERFEVHDANWGRSGYYSRRRYYDT